MITRGDGLIIAYVLSMVAALIAALVPLLKCYGLPHGWKPDLPLAWGTAVRNSPSPPPTRSNGRRAGSTSRCWAPFFRQASSASIMPRSRSRPCRPSSRPASSRCLVQRSCGASRRGRPASRAGAASHLLDHRRAARHRVGARDPWPRRDGLVGSRSPAVPRLSSCSPPKSSPPPPSSAKRR